MDLKHFIKTFVLCQNENCLNELKEVLMGDFVAFSFVDSKHVSAKILGEKLYDYFEKVELKNGKTFGQIIDRYTGNLDDVVGGRIVQKPKNKKKEPPAQVPRARKYYERAAGILESEKLSYEDLTDYSRIMMCLYSAVIRSGFSAADNFEYSAGCLDLNLIAGAIEQEKGFAGEKIIGAVVGDKKFIEGKPKFNLSDMYSLDRGAFVILIIMFYYIRSRESEGEC